MLDDDAPDGLIADDHLFGREPVAVQLATKQVIPPDSELLLFRVAIQPDDFHPVEQRPRDGVGDVGRRDEQDFREVEVDFEVVVAERMVLRRVENFEQCR